MKLTSDRIDLTRGDAQVRNILLHDERFQRALKLAYKAGYKAAAEDAKSAHRRTLPRQRMRAEHDRIMGFRLAPITPAGWGRLPIPEATGKVIR